MPALEAAGRLEAEGIHAAVINSRFVKPIDETTILRYTEKARAVITVEENVLQGGFGTAVVETLQSKNIAKGVFRMGIPDVFVEHGSQQILRSKYGIDAEGIFNNVKKIIRDGQKDSGQEEKKAT